MASVRVVGLLKAVVGLGAAAIAIGWLLQGHMGWFDRHYFLTMGLLMLPFLLGLSGLVEGVTGVPFRELNDRFMTMPKWKRKMVGGWILALVGLFSVAGFVLADQLDLLPHL